MAKAAKSGDSGAKGASIAPRLAFFVLASSGVFVYVMGGIVDPELAQVAPYFLIAILLQFLPFVVRPDPDPFEPAGLTSVLNLLALVPGLTSFIVQQGLTISLLPQVTGQTRVELIQSVAVSYVVATVAYLGGYYLRFGRRFARVFPDVAGGVWARSRVILVCVGCMAIFLPAYAYFQARVGASITDITQLAAGKAVWHDDTTKSWLIRAVGIGFIPPLVLIALNFPNFRWGRAVATFALLLVVGFLATRLGGRGTAVFCLLNALIVFHYLGRKIPMSVLAVLAFVILVVTNLLGTYRSNPDQGTASTPGPTANFNATETLVEHDDDRVRISALAVLFYYFPDRRDYLLGESWGPALTVFIPRWLWPEKNQYFKMRDTGIIWELTAAPVPVPYLGLLYSNFSWIGIVLGMFLWGGFQRGMYEWLLKHNKDRNVVLLYSFIVVYFTPTMLQLSMTIGYALPCYVAIKVMSKKIKAARAAQAERLPAAPQARLLPAAGRARETEPGPGPAAAE